MKKFEVLLIFILIHSGKNHEVIEENLEGPNVCNRIITHNVTFVVTEMVPYQESKMEWCGTFPPRCRKTVIKLKQVNRTEVLEMTQAIRECCDGYKENEQKNRCIPFAENIEKNKTCYHGSITSNETCICNAGWTGDFCNETCSDGFWGVDCQNVCKCQNKSQCRKYDGRCLCELGFTGESCEERCPKGFYGNECSNVCNCPSFPNFLCHHIDGCACKDGFKGLNCDDLDEQ